MAFALDPKNDELMQEMAASANQWCSERLLQRELSHDMLDMLESYVQLFFLLIKLFLCIIQKPLRLVVFLHQPHQSKYHIEDAEKSSFLP